LPAASKEISTKSGGKLTKRWALAVVGTRPNNFVAPFALHKVYHSAVGAFVLE
jgi:hypothetical protein